MVKQLFLACIVLFVWAVGKAQESKTLSSTAQPLLVHINRIPFSVRGSYLVIQKLDSQNHIVSPQIAATYTRGSVWAPVNEILIDFAPLTLFIKIKASNARRTYYCTVKRFGKYL